MKKFFSVVIFCLFSSLSMADDRDQPKRLDLKPEKQPLNIELFSVGGGNFLNYFLLAAIEESLPSPTIFQNLQDLVKEKK